MRSMFRPIKKIFTYIQKNASNGTMFGSTNSLSIDDEGASSSRRLESQEELQTDRAKQLERENAIQDEEDDDIERQIKTSIIDASKVKSKLVAQLDDELADFVNAPVVVQQVEEEDLIEEIEDEELEDEDDDLLEEQFLDLQNFPNNEIIVLSDDINSSLASDNISEDPLAIDEFTQPLDQEEDDQEQVQQGIANTGELLWLKLETPLPAATAASVGTVNKAELRSDGGSDSGLGSENDRTAGGTVTATVTAITQPQSQPRRSNLKRRLEIDAMQLLPELNSSSSASSCQQKRAKRSINFDSVKVYYFPRQQGFSCVPTAGGCTLGMGARHIAFKTMTLAEHAAELRRAHRSQNQEHQQTAAQQQDSSVQQATTRGSSSDDSEESEEDYLSEGSGSDADDGSNGFLQPVTPKQRRTLLKAAGVRKIDASEKLDCRDIRNSREICGCSCREFCDPETCACSQAGIKCQVDRAMFPCGCTREACGNTVGRVEFNPTRVRTHYIHTVMRLDMEQRQSQLPSAGVGNTNSNNTAYASGSAAGIVSNAGIAPVSSSTSSHCYFMQPQSNYSSGYASPAYTPDSSVGFYQQQPQQQQQPTSPGSVTVNGVTTASYATGYPQLDSLDSSLFASGSNATPSYGELLTPTFNQTLGYSSAQLNSYSAYQPTTPTAVVLPGSTPGGYSSCAVPSVPPFGNATTTASNATQYQHANAMETTAASMNPNSRTISSSGSGSSSNGGSISVTSSSSNCSTVLARHSTGSVANEFISLNTAIGGSSSSRLSQINDLLQHNRSTTAALVAVSEGYAAVRSSSSSTIGSIDTPPIVEEAQRNSCMTFEELPPPLINPTPIVAVVEPKQQLLTTPQPRQPLAPASTTSSSSSSLTESLSSSTI